MRARIAIVIFADCAVLISQLAFGYEAGDAIRDDKLKPSGLRYEATVPDTLDLAERARLSVHGLTAFLRAESNYAPYGHTYLNANPPYLSDLPGGPPNWGKIAESLLMTRLMCGSEENLDVDARTLRGMIGYLTLDPNAPTPVSRGMLALLAVYQLDPNSDLKRLIDEMAAQHAQAAKHVGNSAYYMDPAPDERETGLGVIGNGLPVFIQGSAIRPLTRWSNLGGDHQYSDLSGQLAEFLMKPANWAPEAAPKVVVGAEHGQFAGHHHSYTQGLMGLLTYAVETNNVGIKQFVRDSYEYMRTFGIARIGLFGEGCTVGDMTFLALKLSDAGVGDYWEDADQYVRNHLVELQITDPAILREAVEKMPAGRGKNDTTQGPYNPALESNENVIDRNVGVFLSDASHPTLIPEATYLYTICCTGNCTPALYFAWESIVRCKDDHAQVNLLLNRASPWMDVESWLPYEGKVIFRNKTAKSLSVRIPRWVDRKAVRAEKDGTALPFFWAGSYVVFTGLGPSDAVAVTFPLVESTETYTLKWKQGDFWKESTNPGPSWSASDPPAQYTCRFRGNTLVDISPRDAGIGYPLYRRDHLKPTTAPTTKVTRYIPPTLLDW